MSRWSRSSRCCCSPVRSEAGLAPETRGHSDFGANSWITVDDGRVGADRCARPGFAGRLPWAHTPVRPYTRPPVNGLPPFPIAHPETSAAVDACRIQLYNVRQIAVPEFADDAGSGSCSAPVAQGIERKFPKLCAQVRVLPGAIQQADRLSQAHNRNRRLCAFALITRPAPRPVWRGIMIWMMRGAKMTEFLTYVSIGANRRR